ncbi:RidA family protein [Achromobacter spanius]|uniref:Endoribonuclease L-PSP n=1 Tax=Achromobacter spanius TaxID=217203 RepID=A0AAW3I321_9BURK|nr:RidA family protein [Achromobacter spanius]AZS80981.1 RidA family protein [Achromobacter spanius]KNE26207.1 endoribonuclease L-PSP [Achromobacter spanius]
MPHLSTALRTGSLLFLSGQLAFDDKGEIHGDVSEQTALILARHADVLAQHGLGLENVVKASAWVTEQADFASFDQAFAKAFGQHRPTRSTVVSQLAINGAKVEIDLIASFEPIHAQA